MAKSFDRHWWRVTYNRCKRVNENRSFLRIANTKARIPIFPPVHWHIFTWDTLWPATGVYGWLKIYLLIFIETFTRDTDMENVHRLRFEVSLAPLVTTKCLSRKSSKILVIFLPAALHGSYNEVCSRKCLGPISTIEHRDYAIRCQCYELVLS